MRIAHRLLCSALLLAGCASAPEREVLDDPELKAAVDALPAPKMGHVVLAVLPLSQEALDRRTPAEKAVTGVEDPEELIAGPGLRLHPDYDTIAAELSALLRHGGMARSVHEVVARGDAPLDELIRTAQLVQAERLVTVQVRENRVGFWGRNSLFVPNVVLWGLLWFPSFFIADEDYGLFREVEVRVYEVAPVYPKRLFRGVYAVTHRESLDDLERGWDMFGTLTVPQGLEPWNWAVIGRRLGPAANLELARKLVRDLIPRAL